MQNKCARMIYTSFIWGSQRTFLQTGKTTSCLGAAGNASAVMLVPPQYSYIKVLIRTRGVIPHLVPDVVLDVAEGKGREERGKRPGTSLLSYLVADKRRPRTFQNHSVKIADP